MKKIFVLFVIATGMSICAMAQDVIVTKDSKKIDAKILEVSTSEIRYKELDNLDGPIFILRTDEINCIMYANGKVVLYNQNDAKEEDNIKAKEKAEAFISGIAFGDIETPSGCVGKGAAVGDGSASWSLAGRSLVGKLPKPSDTFNQEGTVIVQIRVNRSGDVIEAQIAGGTVSDRKTQQLAIDAALKAKFTASNREDRGKITYKFKFN